MDQGLRLLILEDVAAEAELTVRALKTAGLDCSWRRVESETDFRAGLREPRPDIVLSDFSLPRFDGLSALAISVAEAPDIPFIFVSGTIGEERATEALKRGAVDYVLKTNLARLGPAVKRALAEAASQRARRQAEERVARLTRVLQMLSGINTAVVRVRDRTELLEEACRIAHTVGNYICALVVLIDPATRIARGAAWAGTGREFLGELTFRVDDCGRNEPGETVTGRALRTGEVSICDDVTQVVGPLRFGNRVEALGIRSLASIPLLIENTPVGTFTVGGAEPGMFGEEEMRMLQEVAANLSFALQYLYKEDTVRFLSYFDPVTGLAKRSLFCERLARSLGRNAGQTQEVVVVAFDVERLGAINDSLGRHVGDRVLQFVADALRRNFGGSEWLAHLDGGNFAAVVLNCESYEEGVRLLHDRVTAAFGAPLAVAGHEIPVTVRAGLARYPENGADAESLLQNAEAALHQARNTGERFLRYRRELSSEVADRLALERRLRMALEADQFALHYQPKVSIETGELVGAEGLLRWNDPEGGVVSPAVFLPVLESTGLIVDVGEWVVRQAARDLERWAQQGQKAIRLAVNVSPLQLRDPHFAARFFSAAGRWGCAGACGIDIEITEGALLDDTVFLGRTLQRMRDAGVQIAIDDFGTGYSSLSRLADLPVDTLKIDRSFISRLAGDKTAQAVVGTIISLARAFDLCTVAEGVEREEELALLRELRCEQSQGYLHSRPLPAHAFETLLARVSESGAR
ncbi:MAG TPA: EAL domain-containing protein [Steroidobacteraceae bacterium]|nr:EAL domain-containing protein [Steroidobacteraceae bacterium]